VLSPPGWFPDPSGRAAQRWFDGATWTDWVTDGEQVTSQPLAPPATGGGTLVTEPVLRTTPIGEGRFRITTPAGAELAGAADIDGQRRRLEVTDTTGASVLRLRRTGLGSSATVSARLAGSDSVVEVGRYEASPTGVRVLARAAVVATIPVPPLDGGPTTAVDAGNAAIARLERRAGVWQTELARPLGDPLHPLIALAPLAILLLEA
jgi:hypothetical protein